MPRRIPARRLLAAASLATALSALPALAMAHVSLVSSDPAAGTNLHTAPSEVTLSFDGELDPDGSGFTVLDHHGADVGGGEVDLDVAERNVLRGTVTVHEPGVYSVEWTVLGVDGHEITGRFSFGYATDDETPDGETGGHGHENPDTAMPAVGTAHATLLGLALLLAAGQLAVRRTVVG